MQELSARFLVTQDALSQGAILIQVTTGARGEILSLAVDRNWWLPDRAEPPYRYSITSWRDGSTRNLHLDPAAPRFTHVQALGNDRFLLASRRARGDWHPDNALIVTSDGITRRRFSLSDGIQDVQADPTDGIWVSYFDEGIFSGLDLSAEGLVRFDPDLNPVFGFNTLARQHTLPEMYDCYALNVASDHDAYTYYYGASADEYFPLVHVQDGDVAHVWRITTVKGSGAVAVNATHALFGDAYQNPGRLTLVDLATGAAEEVIAVDPEGQPFDVPRDAVKPLASETIWGRWNRLYLLDRRGVWEIALS